MTLPNANKPSIDNTINTIIEDIRENLAYLDTEPAAYSIKIFSRNAGVGSGTSSVTGVGFEPRVILLFYCSDLGCSGVGYYGESSYYDQFTLYKNRAIIGGNFYRDSYRIASLIYGMYRCAYWNLVYDSSVNYITGRVESVNSDGFTWSWTMHTTDVDIDNLHVVAFCIK
jgi:hypothetical protein